MEMQGIRQLAITQQQAWGALNDPEVLKLCIPGCDKIEATAENQYSMAVSLKIGPLAAKFTGKISLSDINPPNSYTITFEGQGGPAGFGKGNAKVQLAPNADGLAWLTRCTPRWVEKIAQVGQRLIDGVAKSMAEDFFKRFDKEMQSRHSEAYAEKAAAGAVAPQDKSTKIPSWVWLAAGAALVAVYLALR
jgi:carbon monoxide dehydrogenase subunit G